MTSFATPLQLGPLLLKNRVIMSSLTRDRNRVPGPLQVEYYTQRTGAGLILTEGTLIEPQGTEWTNAPGIYSDEQVAGWKKIVDSVHAHNGHIFLQLWHVGRVAHPLLQDGRPNVAPSAIAAKGGKFRQLEGHPGFVAPTAIDDPEHYIALYKRAAERAKEAGFDGVELHSANGYLSHQFIDNTSNQRTDQWGGSVENRCRFPLRIIDEISGVFGNDRVGIKLSPSGGYNDMGMTEKDTTETFGYLIKELNARRIAYIQLTRYWPFRDPAQRGTYVDIFQWRNLFNSEHTKFFANTEYDSEQGAKALKDGLADAIVFGRLYIANPDLAQRLINNQELNTNFNVKHFYGGDSVGYTDYPTDASRRTANFTFIYNTFDANGLVNGTVTSQRTLAYLPSRLDVGSYWIIFAAGLGGLLDSLLIAFFVIRRSPMSITKTLIFDYFNAVVAILSLLRIGVDIASIAFSFAQFNNSDDFFFNGSTDSSLKYIGHFTLEAFNCNLKNYATDVETFNQWCIQGVSY
ncbi:unnamed protein product [Adineta steineri]|uniref:NADH:flavin oxidoreductase/NADH oxidase N-terminal domain-containing protein n=1 Tax=Adineta steineri TaxID=433720 RepID=A0A815BQR7_9BILA|nr:unnamed protein product [Adineta steineri]